QSIVTIWVVISLMWNLFRIVPGDPTMVFVGSGRLSAEDMAVMRKAWGLDAPLWQQYFTYLENRIVGNVGTSVQFRQPVLDVILPALGNTLLLMAPALILAVLLGIFLGALLGWHRGSRFEKIGSLIAILPRSMPVFWIGILLLMIFAYGLKLFPAGGIRTPGFFPETWYQEIPFYDVGMHLILPVTAAVIYFISDPMLLMRSSLMEVKHEDYMTFAHATGLPERQLRQIAVRNAILPVVTYTAIMVSFAFGGQVLLEVVFSWPGMGRMMVTAVSFR